MTHAEVLILQNQVAILNALMLILDIQHPRSSLARQLHKMAESTNDALKRQGEVTVLT